MDTNEPNRPRRRRSQYNAVDGFVASPKLSKSPLSSITLDKPAPAIKKIAISDDESPLPIQPPEEQTDSILNKTLPGSFSSTMPTIASSDQPKKTRRFFLRRRADRQKWSWGKRFAVLLALLVVAGIGYIAWDAYQLVHKVNHLSVGNLTASVGGAENILVAGSTNRCNLKVQNAEWGFCSQGVTGVNSDIIFIVHIVPKTHTVSLLSIPRDTFVPNARSGDQAFKIDAALYQGPTQLVNAIQEDFGIPIQHYVEVGFDGFVNVVNAVGGIKMDFPMPVYDSESYLDVKTPGCKLLNGVEALQVVRARHLQYDPPGLDTSDVNLWPQEAESDIARIARTHEFLRVLASTVAAKGIGNPITDQKLVDAIAPQVQVDSGLSTGSMLQLLEELHAVNINNVPQYTLPISTPDFGSYYYGGTSYGDVVFPLEPTDQKIINEFLGVSNSTDTMTGKSLPSASSVNVNVINGSGTPDQAANVSSGLQALGFTISTQPESGTPLSDQLTETVVNYASPSSEAEAEAVAHQLNGPVILSQNASSVTAGSDVTVVTGTGVTVNAAAGSNAGSSTSGSSTASSASSSTSTASTTGVVTGLTAPSSPMQPLSAWDPRACSN